MSGNRTYHLIPTSDGWDVFCGGRRLDSFATRDDAIACARERTRSERHALVVVHSPSDDLEQDVLIAEEPGDFGTIPWVLR